MEALTAEYVEGPITPKKEGARPYWRVHFAGGKKAKTWSDRCADAIEGKAKGVAAEYELEAADNPSWDPKITKVVLNGESLYDSGGGGGGPPGGRGSYGRSPEQELGERCSIEAQKAAGLAAMIAVATMEHGDAPKGFDPVAFIDANTPLIADVIHKTAADLKVSGGGDTSTSVPSEAGAHPPPSDSTPQDTELLGQARELYGNDAKIVARYNRVFAERFSGKVTAIEAITDDALSAMITEYDPDA